MLGHICQLKATTFVHHFVPLKLLSNQNDSRNWSLNLKVPVNLTLARRSDIFFVPLWLLIPSRVLDRILLLDYILWKSILVNKINTKSILFALVVKQ